MTSRRIPFLGIVLVLSLCLAGCSILQPTQTELEKWQRWRNSADAIIDVAETAVDDGEASGLLSAERVAVYRAYIAEARRIVEHVRGFLDRWSDGSLDEDVARNLCQGAKKDLRDVLKRLSTLSAADGLGVSNLDV